MNPDHQLDIATAPRRNAKHWKAGTVTWGEVLKWVDKPASKKEAGGYVLGKLARCECSEEKCHCTKRDCGHLERGKRSVISRSAIALDMDYPSAEVSDSLELGLGLGLPWAALVHTTYSSSPDDLRYRILLPTDRDMTAEEYYRCCIVLMDRIGTQLFDSGSSQPERYMFKPAAQQPDWFSSWVFDGDPMPVDEVLADYDEARFAPAMPKPHPNKRNPYELDGVVGAFNRVYEDVDDVIVEYELPYEPAGADRWHLVGASSEAGMGIVSDGLYYSHHVTDPAGGQTCSAFDLVRLHRFHDLDSEDDLKKPVNRRPSHEAMMDLAMRDNRVMAEMVGVDFDPDLADDVQPSDWKLGLRMSARTGKLQDVVDNWDLIRQHDPVFAQLYYNEMTLSVETEDDLPWRPLGRGGATFTGNDRAELGMYVERTYKLRPPRTLLEDLVTAAAMQRYRNPVREYLLGLSWDGKPRVETCLPGVTPTDYTRLVARKVMTAAVARMLDPGVKWDHTLVLYGDEGLGKSFWIDRMAKGWSATLGRIDNKDTLLAMQRTWVVVADEGHSLRKADQDALKEFLTRTEDMFRMPYEKETLVHKRHCVIWSTTNDEVFLRRQEGNRRFLIVHCEGKVDFDALTDEYVDQVWAEAVHLYREGERLFLTDKESQLAKAEREPYVEEDALGGIIQEYLDTLVPDNWDDLGPDARLLWRSNQASGFEPAGTERITMVCSTQIWVEAMGRRIGDHRRADLLEINAALKRIPGWRQLPGRRRVPHYGPQVAFVRDEEGLL